MYIPGWTIQTMHQGCEQCDECTENALKHANETEGTKAQSSFQSQHQGQPNQVLHAATVIKR